MEYFIREFTAEEILYQNEKIKESEFHKTFVPVLTKDGNKWCALYGDNLQVGIAGFGDTPAEAILEFNGQFFKN